MHIAVIMLLWKQLPVFYYQSAQNSPVILHKKKALPRSFFRSEKRFPRNFTKYFELSA